MFWVLPDQPQEKDAPDSACCSKHVEDRRPAQAGGAQNATQGQRYHSSELSTCQKLLVLVHHDNLLLIVFLMHLQFYFYTRKNSALSIMAY
jgi:hypothetical protein